MGWARHLFSNQAFLKKDLINLSLWSRKFIVTFRYSPRLVSISVVLDKSSPSEAETTWVMQYGQFLAHDLALSSVFRMSIEFLYK